MKKILFLTGILLMVLLSCRKENNTTLVKGLPRMEDAISALNADDNGALRISAQKTMDAESVSGQKILYEVWGKFWAADNSTLKYGTLSIDGFILSPKSSGVYQSEAILNNPSIAPFFGKTVDIQVEDDDPERSVVLQSGLYVPADITVSAPIRTSYNQVLAPNTEIIWNPDTNNTKGVYILIEFDPEDDDNAAFNTNDRQYRYNLIQTEDDGSFTLSAGDFSEMPAGARIWLWVGRGNYTLADGADGIQKYSIYSYSVAFDEFILGE